MRVNLPRHWSKWVVMTADGACSHDDVCGQMAPDEGQENQMSIYGELFCHYTS